MATITQMASASAVDVPRANAPTASTHSTERNGRSTVQRIRDTKYRHVFATHSSTRSSCLSDDANASPSFVGFRNLMILVLSMLIAVDLFEPD